MRSVKRKLPLSIGDVLLFIALFAFTISARADYRTGVKAYQEQDYQKAFDELRQLAELGHAESQYALGAMYYKGEGVNRNLMLAYGWIRLAADSGNARAKDLEPKIRLQMEDESIDRARTLLNKYTPDAISNRLLPKIIENCEYQNGTPPDPRGIPAAEYPEEMLRAGVEGFVLLSIYVAADGTVRDARIVESMPRGAFDSAVLQTALRWKMRPATRNCVNVSTWAYIPNIFKIDGMKSLQVSERVAEIKKQAEDGDPSAQYVHAMLLSAYPGYGKPWSEVLPWLLKSAQAGVPEAQYMVARSLAYGQGCEADESKALEWMLRAAQLDHVDAQVDLARLALKAGPNYDPKKGIFWLERAARNNASGKKYLAGIYAASPDENIRDPKRALELWDAITGSTNGDILLKEIRAAALGGLGRYEEAAKLEAEAIADAKRRRWNLTDLNQRLATYQAGKPWYGDLFTF